MIDLENTEITSPPILESIEVSSNNLEMLAAGKITEIAPEIELNDIPCHTQSVERCVKIVTEASESVTDDEKRLGWILNTLSSRNIMSTFKSKKDFSVSSDQFSRYKI